MCTKTVVGMCRSNTCRLGKGDKMYRPPWSERVNSEILRLPSRVLLRCAHDSGIDYAVQQLHGLGTPRVAVWVDERNRGVNLADILSEAVAAGLGPALFGKQSTVDQVLQALSEFQRVFGPVTIVVGWVDRVDNLIDKIVRNAHINSKLIVVSDSATEAPVLEGFTTVDGTFLKLEIDEAISETRGAISDERVAELYAEAGGLFSRFKTSMIRQIGSESASILSSYPWSWGDSVSVDGVLDALIQRERWADAFELACTRACERLPEFIDDAGNYYFNTGSYSYFWSRLQALPPDVKTNEKIAYWLLSVALATSRQRELRGHTAAVMQHSEAPEVRATTAVVSPTSEMLSETSRALESLRSPATLRAHGFALAWEGERSEPIALFREAMRLAEREGAEHLVVACGVDIAEVEIRTGNYSSGAEWAGWALAEYKMRGLNENLRLKAAVSTSAFAQLLIGNEEQATRLLADIDAGTSYIDVPGYEAIVSTLGDLALLQGDYERSFSHYSSIHENAPIDVYCFTSLSLLTVHIARRDWSAARKLAEGAFAVSRSSTPYERSLGELIAGMAFSESDPIRAEQHLIAAMEGLTSEFHIAQAASWLAVVRMGRGQRKAAVEALRMGSLGLKELGESGWRLFCACHPLTDDVRRLWSESEFEFEFQFLEARKVCSAAREIELGMRSAEILMALAVHSSGLSGEQLHSHVYGDAPFHRSSLKASVSRLRDTVPIGSSPYRIDATFRADFVSVLELVSVGELQKALNLYSGSLLPGSESPLVQEWREHIDETVRIAVLESHDPDLLIQLATQLDDDLEIWESAKSSVPASDYRRPVINARIRRIRATWAKENAAHQ